jgi:pimeloyl-ACP methyl ester carboxylesterase
MRRGRFDRWESIDVPVTLAWGERDRLVTPPRRWLPARTVRLPGCSHLAMWDDPVLVAATIARTAAAA